MWRKIKASFGHSFTILAARLATVWGLLTTNGPDVAVQITDPTMAEKIKQVLPNPDVGKWLIAIGIIVEVCRWRTARKPPNA